MSYVNIDDVQASSTVTEHLVRLGHRRIGLVNGDPTFRNSQMRREGYVRILSKYAFPVDPGLILDGSYSEQWGEQVALKIHNMPVKPTALFATSDIIAWANKVLTKAGV